MFLETETGKIGPCICSLSTFSQPAVSGEKRIYNDVNRVGVCDLTQEMEAVNMSLWVIHEKKNRGENVRKDRRLPGPN